MHMEKSEAIEPEPQGAPSESGTVNAEPHPLERRVQELEEQLRKAHEQAEEEKDRYLRITAEMDARRKRLAEEAASKVANFKLELAGGFLRVVDNLERALQAIPSTEKSSSLQEGIEMTLKGLYRLLEEHGVRRIECAGRL